MNRAPSNQRPIFFICIALDSLDILRLYGLGDTSTILDEESNDYGQCDYHNQSAARVDISKVRIAIH